MAGWRDERACGVAGPKGRKELGQLEPRVDCPQLLLDRLLGGRVLALAEVKPAQRPSPAPEKQRRPPLAPVVVPDPVAGVGGDGEANLQPRQRRGELAGVGRERKAGRVDPHEGQPEIAVALLPGAHVGRVRTLDRCAASTKWTSSGPRAQIRSTGNRLGPDPLRAGWERRHGYVVCLRSHRAAILLASPGRTGGRLDAEDLGAHRAGAASAGTCSATPSTGAGRPGS